MATLKGLSLLLSLIALASAQFALYGITTEFINNDTQTAVYAVSVDPSNGKVTNITESFVYNGGSATIDGISALQQQTGVYWYATDAATPFAYAINVYKKQLMPPLDIGATSIFSFSADSKSGLTYSLLSATNGIFLISIDSTYSVKVVTQFSPTLKINFGYISASAVNSASGLYYLLASTKANVTDPQYKIFSIDVNTGAITHTSNALNCAGFTEYFAYDPTANKLYGLVLAVTKDNHLQYSSVIVDPMTGNCQAFALPFLDDGIVTCSTYSLQKKTLYIHEATNQGGYLHLIDPTTGKDSSHVLIADYYVLESVEVSA